MKAYKAFSTEYGKLRVDAYRSVRDVDEFGSRVIVTLRMALLMSMMTIDVSSRCMIRIIAKTAIDTVVRRFNLQNAVVSKKINRGAFAVR